MTSSLDIYRLSRLSPSSPRTGPSSQRRCTELTPVALTSSTKRRVTGRACADVNVAQSRIFAVVAITTSLSGETNYLRRSLPRDSSPRTSHFHRRRRVITDDRSVVKRDAVFNTNAACLLVDPSARRPDRVQRPFDSPLFSSTPGRRVCGDLPRYIVSH